MAKTQASLEIIFLMGMVIIFLSVVVMIFSERKTDIIRTEETMIMKDLCREISLAVSEVISGGNGYSREITIPTELNLNKTYYIYYEASSGVLSVNTEKEILCTVQIANITNYFGESSFTFPKGDIKIENSNSDIIITGLSEIYIQNIRVNKTLIYTNNFTCINATVIDFENNLDTVYVNLIYSNESAAEIILEDTGSWCAGSAGDNVYGKEVRFTENGNNTFTFAYANDTNYNEETEDFEDIIIQIIEPDIPVVSNTRTNQTYVKIDKFVCINATVTDTLNDIKTVWITFTYKNGTVSNLTLTDTGAYCAGTSGDTFYGKEIQLTEEGSYYVNRTYADDSNGFFSYEEYSSIIINVPDPYGGLSAEITYPPQNSNFNKYQLFYINGTITCVGEPLSECDNVNAELKYNWTAGTNSISSISSSWGIDVNDQGESYFADGEDWIGRSSGSNKIYRSAYKFPLSSIDNDSRITEVKMTFNVVTSRSGHRTNFYPYNTTGKSEPENLSASIIYTESYPSVTPYLANASVMTSTGIKEVVLSSSSYTDIENAKDTVNRFSIALKADVETTAMYHAAIDEYNEANGIKLILTQNTTEKIYTINNSAGSIPFWTNSSNPSNCGIMNEGDTCSVFWIINGTNLGNYNFFITAVSNQTEVGSSITDNRTINII